MVSLFDRLGAWSAAHVPNVIRFVLIPIVAYIAVKILHKLIRRMERLADDGEPGTLSEREKRAQTLGRILRQVITVFVWGIAVMSMLSEIGVSIGPILAGAGIAGLAVGFGAQTLVKDLIAGFFVLLENQFRVNDVIKTANVVGTVEAINLRTTVLRDAEGQVHIIPNGSIDVVTNFTRDWSSAVLDIGVAYREDIDRVYEVLRRVGEEMARDPLFGRKLIGGFEYPGVQRFADSAVVVRMAVKTLPQERWNVLAELRRRVKREFDREGIEIPFPHIMLYMHDAPPLVARPDGAGSEESPLGKGR